jgi:DNA invertase Pin-like site-specific DNA recombinase
MMNPTPKNIIELLRVSTDSQDVARQRTDLERLKKRLNLNAVRTLELHGVSGTATLDNKQVQQVLNDLGRPDVHGIGLSSLDRLFRPGKRYGQFAILDRFVDEGKVIWSLREGEIDPATDEGYDKCISAGGRAGAEWRELRRRTRDGRRETLEKGKLDCGKARYGYVYIDKHHPDPERRQTYELDPVEALPGLSKQRVIRDVFAWCKAGTKTYSIAKRLNEAGILSPGYRGHPPGLWSRETVRKLLKSRTYTGEHIRSGIIVPCPRIIDDETFALVQERMEESKRQHVGRPSSLYLLRSYVWCGKCQHRCVTHRTTHRGKVYGQYCCGNFDNKPPQTRNCHAPGIGQVVLETAAWAMIWEVLTNPVLLLEMGQAYYDRLPRPESEAIKELERELARLRDREEVVLELMKRKLMKIADGQKEIEQDVRPRVAMIREELRMAGRIVRLPGRQEVEATLREITDGPEPLTYQGRRNILEKITELRMLYLEGEVEIFGKVPISTEPVELTASGQKNCHHGLQVIVEEGPPGLGGRLAAAHQVFAHTGLADVDAELEQLAVNPRRSPESSELIRQALFC